MSPLITGTVIVASLLAVLAIGVPVGIAMCAISLLGLFVVVGPAFVLTTAETLPYAVASDFAFVVIPMFILMGTITSTSGITTELYTAAHRWMSGLRGGLYYATTLAAGGFGAINGSTVVSSSLFTRIALPEMMRFKYSTALSAGCIAAAGTFAALIPPSLAMVIYALLTEESVGALLMAGVFPGLLTIAVYFVGLGILIKFDPNAVPKQREHFTLGEKLSSLKGLWAIILLIGIVMGGIYSGAMFPSAAGAVGAGGALAISLIRRRLTGEGLANALKETILLTATLFLIIIGGLLLSRLLLVSGFISNVSSAVTDGGLPLWAFLLILVAIYVVLGMFIDGVSMLVMTVPFIHPVAISLGVDPVWFGVIVVKLVEIGAITPPVGLNLFAVMSASDGKVNSATVFRGIWPFLVMEMITLLILILVPQISLWLPGQMYG